MVGPFATPSGVVWAVVNKGGRRQVVESTIRVGQRVRSLVHGDEGAAYMTNLVNETVPVMWEKRGAGNPTVWDVLPLEDMRR